MKVVFFAGFSKSILLFNSELISSMVAAGHDVTCIGPESEYKEQFEALGASFISVSFNRHSANPIKGISVTKKLVKIFKENKFDVFYGFTAVPATYGVYAAKIAGIKHIFVGVTGAGKVVQSRPGLFNKTVRAALTAMLKMSFKCCEKVFFLNYENLNYFVKHKIVKESQCVKVGGSGVNMNKHTPCELPKNDYFLFIGSLMVFKGIKEYMQAARLVKRDYPNAEFHIVGEIDNRISAISKAELDEYINDNSVIYEGYQNDVRPFLRDCRYFVLPSYSEGIPTCVLEAMATGRPIITTDAPGCRETVINHKNGLIVPVKDAEALKDAMIYLIEHPEEAEEMAASSLEEVKNKFDVNVVNTTMMDAMNL